jgi:cytochrome c
LRLKPATHAMPLEQYRILHWNARVTDAEVRTLANWAHATSASQVGQPTQSVDVADPVRGKELFGKRCSGCHSLTQNRQGPRLHGVYGRVSGTVADYAYSATLKKARIVWDEQSLDSWLTDPDAFLAGNAMDFLVSRPQERRDILAYLRQSSGK